MKSVVVFCGSQLGHDPDHARTAEMLGLLLVERKLTLVYGGGSIGLMGVISRIVMLNGGTAIGVITKDLNEREKGNQEITKLHIVDTMHERKRLMAELSDGAIVLPGALGTRDELFEWLTWNQLSIHNKPCCVINTNGSFRFLFQDLDRQVADGFLAQENRDLLLAALDPESALDRMDRWRKDRGIKDHYEQL